MVKRKIFCCLLLFIGSLTITLNSYATHIVGGNMNYRYLGNNKYELTLTMFRDCYNGVPPFDAPASIGIFDVNNNLLQDIRTSPRSVINIPPSLDDSCYKPPVNVCYERAIYIDTVTLPLRVGGYKVVYQRCCRNVTIQNIISPNAAGASYTATIPTDSLITNINNSNPVFKAWPQLFLCANKPLVFDHSAIDYDGDSLAYDLYLPLDGASQAVPMPQPPNNPPYVNVIWQFPYSTNDMMGGVPMKINASTGLLTATPNTQGQFVVGIKCEEYRNGVLISETLRDFQFNVVVCQKFTTAATIVPLFVCTNQTPVTVGFANNSTGANAYSWNFGNASTVDDTSHLTTPNYSYTDTGYFDVSLIAYGIKKGCNDTIVKKIHIAIKPQAQANFTRVTCQDTVKLTALALNAVYPVHYSWTLGDGTTSTDSVLQHTYSPNNYTAQLITTTANGCTDTIIQQITIPAKTPLNTIDVELCKYNTTMLNVVNCTNPQWSPNISINNTTIANPTIAGNTTMYYYIDANTISSNGEVCPQHDSVKVTVNQLPTAVINFDKGNCTSTIMVVNASTTPNQTIISSTINWGDGSIQNGTYTHTYTQVGNYNVTLIVTDNKGCTDTISTTVNNFNLPKGKKQTIIECEAIPIKITAQYAQYYNWTPTQLLDSTQVQSPVTRTDSSITYYCTLTTIVTSADTCVTQDTVVIKVSRTKTAVQLNLIAVIDTIVVGETTTLNFASINTGLQSILINDNSTHAVPSSYLVTPTQSTTYYATIKDSLGCVFNLNDSVRIVVLNNECKEPYVLIPTGFTPNNDGVNDEFILKGLALNSNDECTIVVYNRWGQKVFETNTIKKGWDGTYNGLLQDAGAYAYIVKLTCRGGQKLEQQGNVTLIR